MSNQHADPTLTVRPPAHLKTSAHRVLAERNREMRSFVVACLAALAADPDHFLSLLDPHWPAKKPRGRPPKPGGR